MDCDCGGRYKRFAFSIHAKTHKHQTSLQKKEEEKKEKRKEKKQVIRTVIEAMFKKIQELEAKVREHGDKVGERERRWGGGGYFVLPFIIFFAGRLFFFYRLEFWDGCAREWLKK